MSAFIKAIGISLAVLAILAVVVGFIDIEPIFRDRAMRTPAEACPRLDISQRRCDAVVARALEVAGVKPADVASVELGRPDGVKPGLGGYLAALVRVQRTDGVTVDQEVWCIGISSEYHAWCVDDPPLLLWAGVNHDVPCSGDDPLGEPKGCATPIVLDPEAIAQARALRIDAIDIPLTAGHHEIDLGRATLPNGYLDTASFTLADLAPDGVVIRDGIRLTVASTDPSRPPFGNAYERGTFPGVEEVVASLVFDVVEAPPGAVLQVRDVIVR